MAPYPKAPPLLPALLFTGLVGSFSALGPGVWAAPALPQDGSLRTAPDSGPRVILEALDGTTTVRRSDAPRLTSLREKGAAFVRFVDVAPAAPEPSEAIAPRDFATLELTGGDRLAGAVRGGSGDLIRVALKGGVELELSIDSLRSVVFAGRIPDSVATAPAPGDDGDRLYLVAAGSLDRATGFVESFGDDGVTFEDQRVGARTFEWDRVAALFITPLDEGQGAAGGSEEAADQGERVSVSLVGGGRLSGQLRSIGSAEEGVVIALSETAEVALPGGIVSEVSLDDGSFRFLSDLAPAETGSASPFGDDLGFSWPMRVDRNCQGGILEVGGVEYARGIGVHAPSKLRWELDGTWTELRLAFGVDGSGSNGTRSGAVKFRVLGDGQKLFESAVIRAGERAEQPGKVISLSGVKSLILEVDPAGDFVLDRANWLRPMLVR